MAPDELEPVHSASEGRAPSSGEPDPFIVAQEKARHGYGRFNLAIIGNTGVGKSSLVNAVFGRDLAAVGKGLPVTRGVHYYHDDVLGIWDVEGFEIGSALSPDETLRAHLETINARPAIEHVSVVWYCINAHSDRLTQPDIDMIRELDAMGLPVILVLTKVDWVKNPVTGKYRVPGHVREFQDWLESPIDGEGHPIFLPVRHVCATSTVAKHGKGTGHGLGELVTATLDLSPDDEKDAFRIAQRLNLPWKRQLARPVIAAASSAAAAAAAIPIPIADAAVLAPIQMTMMGKVATIYDLELTAMVSPATLAQLGAQISGQALARSFVKVIPGAGSVINASVAFALTSATGEAWMRLCEHIHTGKINLAQTSQAWAEFSPTVLSVMKKLVERRPKP